MRNVTTEQLSALKDAPRSFFLLDFEVGETAYRFTSSDNAEFFEGNNYIPGFLDDMPEIEITSAPRMNEVKIQMPDPDKTISTLFLSSSWMNKSARVTKIINDRDGNLIFSENAFQGLLSGFSIDPESSQFTLIMSSVWADFERVSGVKTNPSSQQRFFPFDTAFEHAVNAKDKLYWGKDAPNDFSSRGVGGSISPPFDDPAEVVN